MLVASTYRQSEKDVGKGFKAQKYECDILKDLDVIFFGPHTYNDVEGCGSYLHLCADPVKDLVSQFHSEVRPSPCGANRSS